MLDTFVHTQLVMWAADKARRADNGLGFPKRCNFDNSPKAGGFWTPEMQSACIDTDKAVCALLPERRDAVIKCFTVAATQEQKAKMCGCSVNTYKMRLDMACRDVLGYLNDLACGIALPIRDMNGDSKTILKNIDKAA